MFTPFSKRFGAFFPWGIGDIQIEDDGKKYIKDDGIPGGVWKILVLWI